MSGFGKLFASTYTGSLAGAGSDVHAVWGYVIANTGPDGFVELNPFILAKIIGATEKAMQSAIDKLCQPDKRSRTKLKRGRRLVRHGEFLYQVVTFHLYRKKRTFNKTEYQRLYMLKKRGHSNRAKRTLQRQNAPYCTQSHQNEDQVGNSKRESNTPSATGTTQTCSKAKMLDTVRQPLDKSLTSQKFDTQKTEDRVQKTEALSVQGKSFKTGKLLNCLRAEKSVDPLSGSSVQDASPKADNGQPQLSEKEFLRRLGELTSPKELSNWGGRWRNRYRENPEKAWRLVEDLAACIREGAVHSNPGAYADKLWTLFA